MAPHSRQLAPECMDRSVPEAVLLHELVARTATRHPDTAALTLGAETWTYQHLQHFGLNFHGGSVLDGHGDDRLLQRAATDRKEL